MNELRNMTKSLSISDEGELRGIDSDTQEDVELSVVIAVQDPGRTDSIQQLYREYKDQLEVVGLRYEFIFVIESTYSTVVDDLRQLKENGEPIHVLAFTKWHGSATVLSAGFEYASGDVLLTLPAYHQIDPRAIPRLFPPLEEHDMVVVRRRPREDSFITRIHVWGYHAILRGLLEVDFNDLGCGVLAFRREILETVDMYGDQHRFFPVLTSHYGFKIKEIEAPQTKQDTFQSHLSISKYVNRVLDLLSIFFLTKFTHKPLRFFGITGSVALLAGGGLTTFLAIQRLFMGVPLANKPILLLGILLIVLGALLIGIGLIGEIIIFTNSKKMDRYVIEKIV